MSRRDAFAALVLAVAVPLVSDVDGAYILLAQGLILAAWFDAADPPRHGQR